MVKKQRTEIAVATPAARGNVRPLPGSREAEDVSARDDFARKSAGAGETVEDSAGAAPVGGVGINESVGSVYLRRKRLRAEAINAPAVPRIASNAVGFSGESMQPFCA